MKRFWYFCAYETTSDSHPKTSPGTSPWRFLEIHRQDLGCSKLGGLGRLQCSHRYALRSARPCVPWISMQSDPKGVFFGEGDHVAKKRTLKVCTYHYHIISYHIISYHIILHKYIGMVQNGFFTWPILRSLNMEDPLDLSTRGQWSFLQESRPGVIFSSELFVERLASGKFIIHSSLLGLYNKLHIDICIYIYIYTHMQQLDQSNRTYVEISHSSTLFILNWYANPDPDPPSETQHVAVNHCESSWRSPSILGRVVYHQNFHFRVLTLPETNSKSTWNTGFGRCISFWYFQVLC